MRRLDSRARLSLFLFRFTPGFRSSARGLSRHPRPLTSTSSLLSEHPAIAPGRLPPTITISAISFDQLALHFFTNPARLEPISTWTPFTRTTRSSSSRNRSHSSTGSRSPTRTLSQPPSAQLPASKRTCPSLAIPSIVSNKYSIRCLGDADAHFRE